MTTTSISPSPEAPVLQDLPSLGVGEGFRLCRRLNKSRQKYDLDFWAKRRHLYKWGAEAMLEGETSMGGAPPVLFWPSWPPSRSSLAHGPSSGEKLIKYFCFDF
jgi:hypothetical protein